ncbi:putative ribonuclease H-like domain-containing protein [Tanacetum coccineum]|uniref:Ribonuclease H-like domain-containing protein n=1 Tax=Tanacetum coccineum TaxID=301880 RepID=A0ABQ5FN12_9ASTR
MNHITQRRDFSKSYSSVRRPFAKTTAQMSTYLTAVRWDVGESLNIQKEQGNKGIFDSVCSGQHESNKDQLEIFKMNSMGDLLRLGGIQRKQTISTSQTAKAIAFEEKDDEVELIVVPSAVKIPEEKDESRTSSTNSKKEETLTEPQKEKKDFSTDTSGHNPKIQAFRRELEEIALKHLGTVPKNNTTSTSSVNTGSEPVNTGSFDDDDSPMLELEIFHKSETGIFDEAFYDEEGVITDFNSLPTEIEVSPTHTLRIHSIHPKSQILGDPKEHKKMLKLYKNDSLVKPFNRTVTDQLQQVWFLVDLPQVMNVLVPNWVYINKRDERGVVVRNKARLVAQGYTQEEGIDYDEVFAHMKRFIVSQPYGFVDPHHPTKMSTMGEPPFFLGLHVNQKKGGIFISQDKYVAEILKKFDLVNVKAAITPMETKVPLTKDEEAIDVDVHLYRSMIGNSKAFSSQCVKRIFSTQGQTKLGLWNPRESPCVTLKHSLIVIYGGLTLTGKSTTSGCQFLEQRLISWQSHKCGEGVGYRWMFNIDYLTDSMNYIPVSLENQANPHAGASEVTNSAGLQVKQNKGGIFISQDKYVAEILKKFDLVNVKAAITPMETKVPLTKDEEAIDVDVHLYRSMIGSLMYLTASRPDIMYAVCVCSRFQVTPKTSHLNAVKRIFKYLKGKPNLGLWYPRESPFDLEAFSDSDYGGSNLDRKSTTGGCQFLGQRLISWQCKKQTIVATSTTEAEYVAAANCCGQVLWVQNQLLDYGFNFMNTKIHIDNESIICIVKNPVYHSKTKHIEIRHHFIRDCYEKKLISVEKIHTDLNVADLLTKPFDGPRFNYLVVSIGQEHDVVAQSQPSSSTPPVPSTSSPPVQSPPPTPASIPTPTLIPETKPAPFEHTFEEPSPVHQHFSPPQEHAQGQMPVDDLLRVLVKKVKKLEGILKRRNVVLSDSEEEESEAQGRKSQDDPLDSLVQGLVTPSTTKVKMIL